MGLDTIDCVEVENFILAIFMPRDISKHGIDSCRSVRDKDNAVQRSIEEVGNVTSRLIQ